MRARERLRWFGLGALGVWLFACGSRTGLPDFDFEEARDAEVPLVDASPILDAGLDGPEIVDAFPPPPPLDAIAFPDVPALLDVAPPPVDAPFEIDANPPIDATPPPIDAISEPDANQNDCPDAAATLIYVITSEDVLYSFYPPTLTFHRIGTIVCPAPAGTSPFSMSVDRLGKAYVVFTDGHLYRVSTSSAACIGSTFVPDQHGFDVFGMGFVSNTNGPDETLYVAQDPTSGNSIGLAQIDTTSFVLSFVDPWSPPIPRGELSGTGDGRLFGFYTNQTGTGSHIVQIDKSNATIIGDDPLTVGTPNDAFAFAFWGGDFYVFTSPGGSSTVTRFSPDDHSQTNITTLAGTIVGAGVSTCAPE